MADYTELVKFLRGLSPWAFPDASKKRMHNAAAAIEALQAEVDTLKRTDLKRCQECLYLGQPVGEQLMPKRGEWIDRYDEDDKPFFKRKYVCSACGGWNTYGKSKYCPNCGAKMEVQK